MKRNVIILILLCLILSSCSNKKDLKSISNLDNESTFTTEILAEDDQREASESSTENIESTVDQEFEIEKTYNGVAYQLGEENSNSEPSVLTLKGNGLNKSDGKLWFQGILDIDDKKYNLTFETDGSNMLSYANSEGYTRVYGQAFISNDFSNISINIIEDGWSNEDGSMLTYPCESKAEGLEIANIVMEDYLLLMGIPKLK